MLEYSQLRDETNKIFANWDVYLKKLSADLAADMMIQLTEHVRQRNRERNIKVGQIRHILKNEFELLHIQKSTRIGYFKFRLIGSDFDDKKIELVVIPGEKNKGYKVITAFYSTD